MIDPVFAELTERLAILRWEAQRLQKSAMRSLGENDADYQLVALGAREAARMVEEAEAAALFHWANRGDR